MISLNAFRFKIKDTEYAIDIFNDKCYLFNKLNTGGEAWDVSAHFKPIDATNKTITEKGGVEKFTAFIVELVNALIRVFQGKAVVPEDLTTASLQELVLAELNTKYELFEGMDGVVFIRPIAR